MPRPSKTAHKLDIKFTLRISSPLQRRMKTTAERLEMEDAEAMRLAARIGFHFLHGAGYDLEGSVIERAMRKAKAERARKAQ